MELVGSMLVEGIHNVEEGAAIGLRYCGVVFLIALTLIETQDDNWKERTAVLDKGQEGYI